MSRVADTLARSVDVDENGCKMLDELAELFDVRFTALTFVSDNGRQGSGHLSRSECEDLGWWRDLRLDLDREKPSGIASAVFAPADLRRPYEHG